MTDKMEIPNGNGKDYFSVEESAALLRVIYPNWPDIRNPKPCPDLQEFLRKYREEH